ncbi:MAG: hypothetical protein VX900_04975 [Pseudomonadota bacterium]|nr:hypothetical protein [Pseudomonadota bacterium]
MTELRNNLYPPLAAVAICRIDALNFRATFLIDPSRV